MDTLTRRLELIAEAAAGCKKCSLHECRTQTVPGNGAANTRLVLVGEAPGHNEDREGLPFIGKAGQLLDNILLAAGISRREVFVCNALKCRPPGNRTPTDVEVAACNGFLKLQLKTINPEVVLCLGAVAAQAVLRRQVPSIGALRGQVELADEGWQVVCTYHPSFLLRNPDAKPLVWEDMQIVIGLLGQMATAASRSVASTG